MSGLRAELEYMVAKADQRIEKRREAGRVQIAQRVDISLIRGLLAAHPAEPALVANPERVAEVLAQQAGALLAAGVFRDEATVKAEALEEAALGWAGADEGDVVSAFLDARATALRAGEPS